MKPDIRCNEARVEISARLDGELAPEAVRALDEHLESCNDCRAHEARLAAARRAVRAQVAEQVPDLTDAILSEVARTGPRARRRDLWTGRVRYATLGAAAGAILVLGASLPFTDSPPDAAVAAEIARAVRVAAVEMTSYDARFEVTEHGWHAEVPVRSFVARVSFSAPETLALTVRDTTPYPSGSWPRNDVRVAGNGRRWWAEEPATCPRQALPGCTVAGGARQRTVIGRPPFDGSTAAPTDIIVPLETIAAGAGLEVVGAEQVGGRDAYRVALAYRNAVPLVHALMTPGSWREFHPADRVDVWIDRDTWFPLRVEVRAAREAEREDWAHRHDYDDRAGDMLLEVVLTSLSRSPADVRVPRGGIVRDAGFRSRAFDRLPSTMLPQYRAGLRRYRAGTTADSRTVATFARGLTWLKVVLGDDPSPDPATAAEEIGLGDGRVGYYEPAGALAPRRLTLYASDSEMVLETNLPRAELLRVAASLDAAGQELPDVLDGSGVSVRRLDPRGAHALAGGYARRPGFLPDGYRPAAALLSRAGNRETLTVFYRRAETEYDGVGIRITQSRPARRLVPSSEEFGYVELDGVIARWSTERGELEWVEGGVYRAVAAPSLYLESAARIAGSMR